MNRIAVSLLVLLSIASLSGCSNYVTPNEFRSGSDELTKLRLKQQDPATEVKASQVVRAYGNDLGKEAALVLLAADSDMPEAVRTTAINALVEMNRSRQMSGGSQPGQSSQAQHGSISNKLSADCMVQVSTLAGEPAVSVGVAKQGYAPISLMPGDYVVEAYDDAGTLLWEDGQFSVDSKRGSTRVEVSGGSRIVDFHLLVR